MKNLNLIKWLWDDSHEKQKPQRFGRYAAMLMMLLTIGVGQMWATTIYYRNTNSWGTVYIHYWGGTKGSTWGSLPAMTRIGSSDIWYKDIGDNTSCLFASSSTGSNQTGDQTGLGSKDGQLYDNGNWVSTYVASGFTWYFDSRNVTDWATPHFRIGHGSFSSAYAMSNVAGTKYLWSCSSATWGGFAAYTVANSAGWTGDNNTIYQPSDKTPTGGYAITKLVNYQSANVTTDLYLQAGASASTGDGATYYNVTAQTSLPSYTVSFSSPTHATLSVQKYSKTDGSTKSSISTGASVLPTQIVELSTSSWSTGYELDDYSATNATKISTGVYYVTGNATFSASEKEKTYSVTVTSNNFSYGTVMGGETSAQTVSAKHFTSDCAITAEYLSGYRFTGWTYTGNVVIADASSASTTIKATSTGATVTANFEAIPAGELVVAAGANGKVKITGEASWTSSSYTYSDVTTAADYNIYAQADDHYHFVNWTKTGDGTIKTNAASGVYTTVANGTATVTANFAETMSTLSTSCSYDAGNPSYSAPSKSVSSIGYVTTATVTATAAGTGYTFAGWTLTNCTRTDGGSETATSITIRSNGDGAAASVVAKYNEVLTSDYYLVGNNTSVFPGSKTWTAENVNMLRKASGSSTSNAGSITIDVKSIPANNSDYQFKIHESSSNNWYGWSTTVNYWMDDTKTTSLFDGQNNLYFIPNALGDYTFAVNWGGSDPSLTVTFPATTYTVSFGQGSGTGGSASATYSSTSFTSGTKVQNGKSITLTAPSASTGYTWDGWYDASSGGTKVSTSNPLTTTVSSTNYNFYARYTENQYNATVSAGSHGSVSPSGTVAIKQVNGTSITATPDTHYAFTNWTISGGGITPSSSSSATQVFKATSTGGTITANFVDKWAICGIPNWSSWNGLPNSETNVYEGTITLTAGDHTFKVVDRTSGSVQWYGKTSTTITRGSNAASGLTAGGGDEYNMTLRADVPGTYTFNFNTSTKTITVTYPTAYTVTYGAGTINGSDAAISVSPSFTSGDYVLPETDITFSKGDTKDGYTWKGWYSDQAGSATLHEDDDDDFTWSATRTGNISVYACYNFITYDITYNLNSGTNHPSNPATFNVETSTITLQNPTRTGYTFGGWYDNSSLTGDAVTTIAKGTHEDQEFWAKWTANDYTITLKPNGGSGDDQELTATFDAKAPNSDGAGNYRFDAITNPEKTGYTFAGWWTSSDAGTTLVTQVITEYKYYDWDATDYIYNLGCWKYDGDVTLYAKWTPNNYTVTLSCSGETGYGSSPSGIKESVSATYDSSMPAMGTAPTPAPGYKFMGYFLGQNGTGVQYYDENGTGLINWTTASNTTLYAYFRKTEISSLEHPAAVAKGDVVTVDVNPVYNQSGAQDYMAICWSLLYDNDNVVESGVAVAPNPADGKPNQVRFTLTGLSAGYYKVKAVLKANETMFVACDAGTELSTFKSNLRIAGNSTITIQYEDASGNTISAATSVEVARGDSIGVNAPSIVGYTFSEWVLGDVLSSACRDASTCALNKDSINIKAEYDGVLIAKYARKNTIYFKNTLGWPAVYVNLLTEAYWASDGTGNNGKSNRNLAMTQIGTSDVWYYEYDNKSTSHYVSFTSVEQNGTGSGAEKFWGADADENKVCVVYPTRPNHDENERNAYGFNVNTPMFVPLAGQEAVDMNVTVTPTPGRAYYYNKGYWAKYEPVSKETGYTLKIYNKKDRSKEPDAGTADPVEIKSVPFTFGADMTFPVSVTVDLEAGKWYGFKLYRDKGNSNDALSWYGNSGNMSNQHSGDFSKGETVWEFKTTLTANCGLKTNSAGDYVFTLAYGKEAFEDSIQYLIGVHYPEATGDYRLVYSDDNRTGILSTTIPFNSENDTVSFFINKDAHPVLKMQKCEVSYSAETSTVAWTDTVADFFSGGLPSAITKSGVYYFCINKDPETGKKVFGDTKLYEGNFYIRTDGATPSKWDNFRQNNHLMAYSEYADKHENFTHSYTQWYDLTNRKNLKFTVANDYSVSISDTLIREDLTNISDYIDANGDLNRTANVRFMYNQKTNAISRAYIDGAYADGGDFLKIYAKTEDGIYLAAEGGEAQTQITFTDDGNWLYEKTVYAVPGARYKLKSIYGTTDGGKHQITQYFKGGEGETAADSATMIGGSGSSRMQIRLLYDFKTNRVVTAYQPSGTIDESVEIHADIMFMREHQEDIEQITFAEGKSISEIENIYCGLRFNKWTLNNKSKAEGHATLSPLLSRYERDIFYVSFPYDVRLSDAIGFGTYGTHWIVEYYDGAARAKNGFWIDSDSYWKFVTPSMKDTFTLKAGTGYIVALDLDELYYIDESHHASIWNNTDISDLEILFPGNVSSISNIDVTYNMPEHTCTINRGTTAGNRTKKDSHWNVLGVPTFKNITGAASGEPDEGVGSGELVFSNKAWIKDSLQLKFIYDGNLADNSLTPKAVKGFEFKAMHAYVVQYCGDVTFNTSATPAPASVAARTYAEEPIDVDFRLELNKDGVVEDQTFVSLSNAENASADFKFGEDLSKEFNNNRANIYTFIGTEWVAGNTLPITNQTTVIPVGVKIAADGEYTFSIQEGTYGVGITLIDNEAGARVNLGLMDYTVTLAAGQIDDRFVLEISPISQSPTGVELLNGENGENGVRKVLIDNILYIVKDGVVYDAQGKRVQ